MNRRSFLSTSLAAGAVLGTGLAVSAQTPAAPAADAKSAAPAKPAPGTEPRRAKPPLDPVLVKDFVGAGHTNLPRVKELLATEPTLIHAMWDWGAGDWETAIGGASHIGNRDLALYLLDAGSRFDIYCAAMLGETEAVSALLKVQPVVANAPGPHGYTLLYHAGYTGKVALAETIAHNLAAGKRAKHFNQALQTAVGRGHVDFTAYLLDHGVDDPNIKNFQGKTPLDVALAKKFDDVAKILRDHGAVTSG
jgi:hypothetical protein